MNKNTPIICFIGAHHDARFIAAVREIIQQSGLPIVVIQTPPEQPEPIEYKIPDIKTEGILKATALILDTKSRRKQQHYYKHQQNNYKFCNKFRNTRFQIKMRTYNRQRMK